MVRRDNRRRESELPGDFVEPSGLAVVCVGILSTQRVVKTKRHGDPRPHGSVDPFKR